MRHVLKQIRFGFFVKARSGGILTFNSPVSSLGVTVIRPVFKSSFFIGSTRRFGANSGSPGVWPK